MRALTLKLKRQQRKRRHVKLLQETIAELNNGIVKDVIKGNDKLKLYNKAKLLLKYNRRLRLILY
tara:strand:+ start:1845 stop:2039 length:195 start_codon:yes stop_codon:yes gene_type:complete